MVFSAQEPNPPSHHTSSSHNQDINKVMGGIKIDDKQTVGDLTTVNGGIKLADKVQAKNVKTVNGGINLGDQVSIIQGTTVNGGIKAGKKLNVNQHLITVNGGVLLENGALVGGNINTVNGNIELNQAHVKGEVKTKTGDINLLHGTIIDGDVIFEKKESKEWSIKTHSQRPTLTIDESSIVKGKIILLREVELKIHKPELMEKVEYNNN